MNFGTLTVAAVAVAASTPLTLVPRLDAAGGGWVELWVAAPSALAGFHVTSLAVCDVGQPPDGGTCAEVAVFGGTGGAAEAAGLLISAEHAFVHGVFGSAGSGSGDQAGGNSGEELLTTLSVAFPRTAAGTEVCIQGGIHPDYTGETYEAICRAIREAAPVKSRVHRSWPTAPGRGG